jgi:capsular exopolysaccharide synthesis family protein
VVLAVLFALGVVFALEYIDTRVKTEGDVHRYLGLPLLARIPSDRDNLLTVEGVSCEIAEDFNTAATLVRSTARELGMKSFIVTSSVGQEGKTTVSVNLAVSLARKGARVILVDGDLRVPRLHEVLGLANEVGLSSVLESRLDPQRVIDGSIALTAADGGASAAEAVVPTEIENLSVLTSGPAPDDPIQLLESDRMYRLLKELSGMADFVIFDTPPVNQVGDALTLASAVDGTIFVVGSALCEQRDVAWAKHLLMNVQANLLGVILNRTPRRVGHDSYSSSYYRPSERKRVAVEV